METKFRFSLYRYGKQVGEAHILPFLIRQLEPFREPGVAPSRLPDVDPVVTDYELKDTLRKYQVIDYLFKYALVGTVVLIVYGVSRVFALLSPFTGQQDGIRTIVTAIGGLAFFVFWMGAYRRMKSRWEEWQQIRNMELSLEKIEYYAKSTSSAVIAQLLVDIERIKETQKQEAERAKAYSEIQSGTLKSFLELVEEKERRDRGKEIGKQIFWIVVGYMIGRGFDSLTGLMPDNPSS